VASIKVSITEVQQHVGHLIRRAERGDLIEITRRGKQVAVLLSATAYASLRRERSAFIDAAEKVRRRMGVDALGIGDANFEDLRGSDAGRLEEKTKRHRGRP
jgi:prevent-host-death family protein